MREYYGLIIVFALALIAIILPFCLTNNLEGFDAAGHLSAINRLKNYFWPWPDGWDMLSLSGYPQGLFYPSTFHWLAAAISFVVSPIIAVKLLISLAILLFPVLVFNLAKKLFFSNLQASATTLIIGLVYFFNLGLRYNLFDGLLSGLLPYVFSFTIFFLYLIALLKMSRGGGWRWPAICLALTLVTHLIVGLTALFLALVMLVIVWSNKRLRFPVIKHFFVSLLLTVFWWLPSVINLSYSSGSDASPLHDEIILVLIPWMLLLNFIYFKLSKPTEYFFRSLAIFNVLVISISLFGSLIGLDGAAVHFSRILTMPVILSLLIGVASLSVVKINWQFINLFLAFSLFFYFLFFRIIPVGPFETQILTDIASQYKKGRVLVVGMSENLDVRFHSTRMKLIENHQLLVAEGLFVESSANGWFLMSLLQSWSKDRESFIWAYRYLDNVADLSWGVRIFGINYVYEITDKPIILDETADKVIKEKLLDNEKTVNILGSKGTGAYYQYLFSTSDTDLAEAVYLRPFNINDSWGIKTKEWWSTDWLRASSTDYLYDKPLLVYRAPVSDWRLANSKENFSITDISSRLDSFVVDASSLSSPAPIYVKVGYFPFWKAYNDQGQELEIYKASPNFMLVYGQGKIIFKYVKPFYYYLGYAISGLTLAVIVITGLRSKRRKIKEK